MICFYCGVESEEINIITLAIGPNQTSRTVCDDCVNEHLTNCDTCSVVLEQDSAFYYDELAYCPLHRTEFVECYECGDSIPLGDSVEVGNHSICRYCNDENYGPCEDCSTVIRIEDGLHDDGVYCRNCSNRQEKMISQTFNLNKFSRFVGVEIEFTTPTLPKLREWGHLKYDGSIRSDKSHHLREFASFAFNGDLLLNMIDKVSRELYRVKAEVNKSCGLHVHLDMQQSTDAQQQNICAWWQIFEPVFFAICSPSRRQNQFANSTIAITDRTWRRERYYALNISALGRHGTYEIRLHQGSVNGEKIKSWILVLLSFFEIFGEVPSSTKRLTRVQNFSDRQKLLFFYHSLNLPLKLRKYVIKRIREFEHEENAQPVLNLTKIPKVPVLVSANLPFHAEIVPSSYTSSSANNFWISDDLNLAA